MLNLVTLEDVKRHLRVDHDFEDEDIQLKIEAASEIIQRYIGQEVKTPVPRRVAMATLQMVGVLYRDRDNEMMSQWQHGYLPFTVESLVYDLRTPSMA